MSLLLNPSPLSFLVQNDNVPVAPLAIDRLKSSTNYHSGYFVYWTAEAVDDKGVLIAANSA